jgi:small subunit ribosomal protein S13
MVYLLNTPLPDRQQVHRALTRIYGLGPAQATHLCQEVGLGPHIRLAQVTPGDLDRLGHLVARDYETGAHLRRRQRQDIQRLVAMGAVRGFRHREGLPVRGQRTHTNARTARRLHRPRRPLAP